MSRFPLVYNSSLTKTWGSTGVSAHFNSTVAPTIKTWGSTGVLSYPNATKTWGSTGVFSHHNGTKTRMIKTWGSTVVPSHHNATKAWGSTGILMHHNATRIKSWGSTGVPTHHNASRTIHAHHNFTHTCASANASIVYLTVTEVETAVSLSYSSCKKMANVRVLGNCNIGRCDCGFYAVCQWHNHDCHWGFISGATSSKRGYDDCD